MCNPQIVVSAATGGSDLTHTAERARFVRPRDYSRRQSPMSRLALGLVAGVLYGALSALSMVPLQFPDKRAALIGAFLNRLAIGTIVGAVIGAPQVDALRLPPWAVGLAVGVLLSVADAVITKAFAPIIIFGALGGGVIGWLVGRFGK
jgi:hypothetical protein